MSQDLSTSGSKPRVGLLTAHVKACNHADNHVRCCLLSVCSGGNDGLITAHTLEKYARGNVAPHTDRYDADKENDRGDNHQ